MTPLASAFGEIQIVGSRTREWIVAAETCPQLQSFRISAVGISAALPNFRFLRENPDMSVIIACNQGHGHALVEGRSRNFQPGMAYLMPAHSRHGYEAVGRAVWRICWVCYTQPTKQGPFILSGNPALVRTDAAPLENAIRGLYNETMGRKSTPLQKLYVELIQEHTLRIAGESNRPDHLWKLWTQVESDLGRGWTLRDLALEGGMSIESLRILSHQSTGRSPMKHLTFLRMQSAASALASTGLKISAIAQTVGYGDPFAFSVAFKRHLRLSPGEFRLRQRRASIH